NFAPAVKVVILPAGLPGGGVGLDVDDLRHLAAEHREGPADVNDADGLIELVEDENVSVQRRREAAAVSGGGGWSKLEAPTPGYPGSYRETCHCPGRQTVA